MFSLTRPDDEVIASFLARQVASSLTYDTAGMSMRSPEGYNIDEDRFEIGTGIEEFSAACNALDAWRGFDISWIVVRADSPTPQPGTNVAVAARHLGFWSLNGCRVVGRLPVGDGDRRHGFYYGTLQDHAESGEEMFAIEFDPDESSVWYVIRAVSKPRAVLARVGHPISRALQAKFRRESAKAMRAALDAGPANS